MVNLRLLAFAGIAAASRGWANAADLPPAPTLPPLSPAETQFGAWYLRGDVGVGVNATATALEAAPGPSAGLGFASGAATQAFQIRPSRLSA